MLEVQAITKEELQQYMVVGFSDDVELLNRFHHKPGSLHGCIQATMKNVEECASLMPLQYYRLVLNGKPIGFTITGPSILYSFGINIKFRTKELVLEWFNKMKEMLRNDFRVVLYNVNQRAIRFFERNGMENIHQDKEYTILVL